PVALEGPGAGLLPETPQPPDITMPGVLSGTRAARPRSRRTLVLSSVVLAVLLIASVAGSYVLLTRQIAPTPTPIIQGTATGTNPANNQSSPTANLTQTAQAGVNATGTASAQATASSVANATSTASAQANATVGPLQTATAGQPDYQDSLKNGNNSTANWDENSQCVFQSDGYHVLQSASGFKGCREQGKTYGNLALTVDVNIHNGDSGGIFFRLHTNLIGNYDGYLFEIDSQGRAKISYEQGTGINVLRDWQSTSLLKRGYNQTNLLQLIARGSTLSFYINGKYFVQFQNSYDTGTTPATIGFLASAEVNDTEVVYSNLKVYAL
ncbi:MAG TPA: family 16 glycoside hydrolase, partial [Ktedonobacteraceae bacterium]